MLGACGAKEETTVFQQELPSELQGKNLGSSDLKITHKGVKIIKVVSESEIPLTFGLGADELADAKKEIEDNAELSQEEKNNLLAEMEKTTNADPEAQAVEMAKNLDDMYAMRHIRRLTNENRRFWQTYKPSARKRQKQVKLRALTSKSRPCKMS